MKEIKCIHCGSTELQKCSVIHEGGTSTGSSVSFGGVGGKAGAFSTSSTSQTALAKKLAPPPRTGVLAMIFLTIGVLFFGFLGIGMMRDPGAWWIYWLFMAAICALRLFIGVKRNLVYAEKMESYNRLWFCHRCGEVSSI